MKSLSIPIFLLGMIVRAQEPAEPPGPSAEEAKSRSSLALGYREGARAALRQMRAEDFDTAAFLEGFVMALEGKSLTLQPEEVREAMGRLQVKINARELALAATNRAKEEQFLIANATGEGIFQTASGLQYRIVKPGEGEPPGQETLAGSEIALNYRGTLPDGREFIASPEGTPEKFKLEETIPGFREAVSLMPVGAEWVVFIPSALGYGDQRHSGLIGPNQLLIFEIELVDFRIVPE